MMIFRLSCPQHMKHVVSSAAVNSQSWPIFMVHLKVRDLIEKCLEIPRSEGNEESLHGHIFSGRDASTATAVREVKLGLSLSMTEKSGYGERVVHIRSHEKSLLAVVVDRVAGDLRRCLADGVLRGLEQAHVVLGQRCLARDVQTDHRDGNAGLKDNARRFRIHVNIELRRR